MTRARYRKTKAQASGEYAIVLGFVVAAFLTVQILVRRQIQQGLKTGGDYMVAKTYSELGISGLTPRSENYFALRKSKESSSKQPASKTVRYRVNPARYYEIDLGTGQSSTTEAGTFIEYDAGGFLTNQ